MASVFYKRAADYWSTIPATLEGVLGGFGFISETDLNVSRQFLDEIFTLPRPPNKRLALDCGAGIGRVAKGVLVDVFDKVDLVEQNPKFLEASKEYIDKQDKIGDLYAVGLQDFQPSHKYDVIWCQWVLGHLKDDDFVTFFSICKNALTKNGIIVVKENVTSSGLLETDECDSSVTRPLKHLIKLFKQCNLRRLKECRQSNFPKGIYPVYMFALRPNRSRCEEAPQKVATCKSKPMISEVIEDLNAGLSEDISEGLNKLQIEDKDKKSSSDNKTGCICFGNT